MVCNCQHINPRTGEMVDITDDRDIGKGKAIELFYGLALYDNYECSC